VTEREWRGRTALDQPVEIVLRNATRVISLVAAPLAHRLQPRRAPHRANGEGGLVSAMQTNGNREVLVPAKMEIARRWLALALRGSSALASVARSSRRPSPERFSEFLTGTLTARESSEQKIFDANRNLVQESRGFSPVLRVPAGSAGAM